MLVNALIFFSVSLIAFILYKYLKSIRYPTPKKEKCKFRISHPKYKTRGKKKFANFDVLVHNDHTFFVDFPISFKFYSDNRFKAKVKIRYSTMADDDPEELINKNITFETKTKEYVFYITDIIIGKIEIEIELHIDYGSPIIEFEILENQLCDLMKEYKLELKFPK